MNSVYREEQNSMIIIIINIYKMTGGKSATTRTLIGYWAEGAYCNGNGDATPRVDFVVFDEFLVVLITKGSQGYISHFWIAQEAW